MRKIFSVTIFTAMLTLLRMLCGFAIAKIVAIYTGPAGMAMLGQMQSMITSLNGIVTSPVGSGVVRYTAEHVDNGYEACAKWWQASLQWAFGLFLIIAPLAVLLSSQISAFLFQNDKFYWVVILSCIVLPLSIINTTFISVTNGQQQYKKYISVGFISVVISSTLMAVMIYLYRLQGAMVAAALNSSISGVVVLMLSLRQPWLKMRYWIGRTSSTHRKAIGGYVIMAITSAIAVPLSLVLVRTILVNHVGWEGAGQWQAVWKISEVYLAIITLALTTYYLPQLSKLQSAEEIRREINQTAKIILPIVSVLALGVYLFRDLAIYILFTDEFKPARDLFSIQLFGDVIKILAWLYAFPMIAKAAVKWYVTTEIIFCGTLVLFTYYFVLLYGTQGANIAYALNYIFYFIIMFFNLKRFAR
ncbi:O-antigen translocase [Cronobacter dublinensis]|uniref:O-antigen translocase n=1 Tax=Cronobacter dublinensis TaxID=413497 RepID=UPI000CFBD52F|nr:O-antigen translocase [Cronobacter dublinensis]